MAVMLGFQPHGEGAKDRIVTLSRLISCIVHPFQGEMSDGLLRVSSFVHHQLSSFSDPADGLAVILDDR
jgi:hypothetical protein